MSRTPLLCTLCLVLTSTSFAEERKPDPSLLTIDRIYSSGEFQSKGVSARWLPGQKAYTTVEKSKAGTGSDIVRHDAKTGEQSVLVSAEQLTPSLESGPLSVEGYAFSKDLGRVLIYTNSKRIWRRRTRGDYWILDRSNHELRKLGGDAQPSTLQFAKLSPQGHRVAYVRERNIYVEDLRSGGIRRLTNSESDDVINGTFDWVYEEELGLRDGFRWSPDGRSIACWQINTEGVKRFPLVDTSNGHYPTVKWFAYPKTGQVNPAARVGVVNVATGKTDWLNLQRDPRDTYIARMDWANNSREVVVQVLNRLQNTNEVTIVNVSNQSSKTVVTEVDKAWVNVHDELFWLKDGKEFTWVSERDGWRHVYVVSRETHKARLVTPGDYDVVKLLHVDEDDGLVYFIASPDNPTRRFLYRIRLDGTQLKRLTPDSLNGTHSYSINPASGVWALHTHSSFDAPPSTELVRLPAHESVRTLEDNKALRKKLEPLRREPVEFFRVDIGKDVLIDGWCLRPPGFDAAKKYPVLVYVYGEPAGQTVLDGWRGSSYLWHLMMAQKGYVVMSFDNRGTPAPRGRQWRKCVYRQIGTLGPRDQAAVLRKTLAERKWLDASRIGIWGWSGGGSSSLHAIFKYPDLYHTAVSIAPVPNQRYYDTIYQERYMGLPADNVDGYRDGSAMNFAHLLEGNLLVIHGTGDDNCHYQTTELLIDRLIRHNRQFAMMSYPNRTHAIREGKNTTRHLRTLMTNYLLEKLPPGPRSK